MAQPEKMEPTIVYEHVRFRPFGGRRSLIEIFTIKSKNDTGYIGSIEKGRLELLGATLDQAKECIAFMQQLQHKESV